MRYEVWGVSSSRSFGLWVDALLKAGAGATAWAGADAGGWAEVAGETGPGFGLRVRWGLGLARHRVGAEMGSSRKLLLGH